MGQFFIRNFGCRATQADGAAIAQQLWSRGLKAAPDARSADLVVLNTCTVTASADEDARQAIRRAHRENPGCRILVTGCYAQRAPREIAAIPGVSWVVGNSHKARIGELIGGVGVGGSDFVPLAALAHHAVAKPQTLAPVAAAEIHVGDIWAHTELEAAPVFVASSDASSGAGSGPGPERCRPNLKIQDGCGNRCSFCIIPSVRGRSRSLRPAAVIAQVRALERAGYREIVLSGINLGRWGRDLTPASPAGYPPGLPAPGPRQSFTDILRLILAETSIERIRLSSVEPMDFSDELLALMAGSTRVARHVHAPLQSGSNRVLARMRRRYRAAQYEQRITRAREWMPQAAVGADVMVGFPGETAADFDQTRALIERLPFTYLHVFTFSPRSGTPAATMPGQVDPRVARERRGVLVELAAAKNLAFRRRQVGRSLSVITLHGRPQAGAALSDNFLKVRIEGPPLPANRIVDARITGLDENDENDGLVGRCWS